MELTVYSLAILKVQRFSILLNSPLDPGKNIRNRSRVQRFRVQGYVLVPGLQFGGVIMWEAPGFVIPNLKIGGALAIMWQNQHFLRGLWVFNFVLVPNPELWTLNLWTLTNIPIKSSTPLDKNSENPLVKNQGSPDWHLENYPSYIAVGWMIFICRRLPTNEKIHFSAFVGVSLRSSAVKFDFSWLENIFSYNFKMLNTITTTCTLYPEVIPMEKHLKLCLSLS